MKKIVIIGPESTGKSSLCNQLAEHYNTFWCAEYAREYLLKQGKEYSHEDLLIIAKGQAELENRITQLSITNQKPLLFFDTNMYVIKVWCEYVFGKCHNFILEEISKRSYDLYLLCNIDLPWIPDELREYPDEKPRQELFNTYKDILINQQTPWVEVSGTYEERLRKASAAVNRLF